MDQVKKLSSLYALCTYFYNSYCSQLWSPTLVLSSIVYTRTRSKAQLCYCFYHANLQGFYISPYCSYFIKELRDGFAYLDNVIRKLEMLLGIWDVALERMTCSQHLHFLDQLVERRTSIAGSWHRFSPKEALELHFSSTYHGFLSHMIINNHLLVFYLVYSPVLCFGDCKGNSAVF